MKKCPFCAEDIQDEAIKCRFCNSFLNAATAASSSAPGATPPAGATVAPSAPTAHAAAPPFARAAGTREDEPSARKLFYEGVPSWKAFIGHYVLAVFGAGLLIVILNMISKSDAPTTTKLLNAAIPVAIAAIYMFGVTLYRKSIKFRVTNSAIETERGLLSKNIDVLQLWRCRDVRYRQNLIDRILGIAHIEVFAQDATTPHLEIVGMPASRQLFENLRDSIEMQRQHKNVYGVVS